jgi:hypothetical protein
MADTTMNILVDYLKGREGLNVASHDIEVSVPRHGELFFLKNHNGGTYSRKFRELRASSELQQAAGITIKEVKDNEGKEKQWNITSSMPSAALTQGTLFVC